MVGQPAIAALAFPWRPTPDRVPIFEKVKEHYEGAFPMVTGDSIGRDFNRSEARNSAARAALALDADVLILHDADITTGADVLRQAVSIALEESILVIPFNCLVTLNSRGMERRRYGTWYGGINVIRTDAYFRLGGYDEGFTGWGAEDTEFFYRAHKALGSTHLRNEAFHMTHRSQQSRHGREYQNNVARLKRLHPDYTARDTRISMSLREIN